MNGNKLAFGAVAALAAVGAVRKRAGSRSEEWLKKRGPSNDDMASLLAEIRAKNSSAADWSGWRHSDDGIAIQLEAEIDQPSVEDLFVSEEDEEYLDDSDIENDLRRRLEDEIQQGDFWVDRYYGRSSGFGPDRQPVSHYVGAPDKVDIEYRGSTWKVSVEFTNVGADLMFDIEGLSKDRPRRDTIRSLGGDFFENEQDRITAWNEGKAFIQALEALERNLEEAVQKIADDQFGPGYWDSEIDVYKDREEEEREEEEEG
tara:strand:- start:9076 stop:9852 length:777 start_codon:yes stop_codon:yes gene_type:complete